MSPGRALLSALVAIVAVMAVSAVPAGATTTHFFLETFGSAEQPSAGDTVGLAVDQSNGDLLVLSSTANTISRYKPDGTPDDFSALGTNVIDGEGAGDGTPLGGLRVGAGKEAEIAIDNSGTATDGDIYVTNPFRHLVYIFASSGAYLGQLNEYQEGADASGPSKSLGYTCGVAVAPNGTVYVDDYENGVHKYGPTTNPAVDTDNTANFSFPEACNLAVGTGPTAGYIFVSSYEGPLTKVDASTGSTQYVVDAPSNPFPSVYVDPATGDVYGATEPIFFKHFDASGSSGATLIAEVKKLPTFSAGQEVAVDGSSGRVYLAAQSPSSSGLLVYSPLLTQADIQILPAQEVSATRATLRGTVNPDGAAITVCEFEYGTVESGTFSSSAPCEESVPTDSETHTVSAALSGLPPDGAPYHYRLVVTNADGRTSTSGEKLFDLPLRVFTGGPTGVSTGSARLNGSARPESEQITECKFEYGPDASYGASVPCSPEAGSIPTDFGAHLISGQLSGLEEFSVYHYRLSFTTAAGTFTGKDEVFRTLGPSGLRDGRRYEQVSPVDKNQSDVNHGASGSMAAVEGNRIVIRSSGSFAGSPTAQLGGVQYLSTRGPGGWSTESITLPGGEGAAGYQAFTADLSKGVIEWPEDTQIGPYDPNAPRGRNLYLHDTADGSFTLLNGTLAPAETTGLGQVAWGSADFGHLAIASHSELTPEAAGLECDSIVKTNHTTPCAYEWDEGTLRLASIVNGEPVEGTVGALSGSARCGYEHAMSDDGSRLFFTSPPELLAAGELYARENASTTTLISESERTLPGGFSGRRIDFQNAEAAHGNRVLFTTRNSLLDEDTDETADLYLYDYSKPVGERLTLISKDENPNAPTGASIDPGLAGVGDCGGVMGASEDLKRIYFVADNQILAGEPEAAGPKLFLWDDTGSSPTVSYLGKLEASDNNAWLGALTYGGGESRRARLSADGRYLAFLSSAKLTDFDNEGRQEIYRYDAGTQTMECASCSADAVPAEGEIDFENSDIGSTIYNHVSTNVTDSGQVFFTTTRGLIPADSNGQSDVYEYENGRLSLISSGEGPEGSYFLDATPSGSDVFFTTKDRLVGWDTDENADAYDARVNGGFPEPALLPPDCAGDACQPAPNPPNDATPASSSFEGAGNVSEQPKSSRCSKGKVRRHGRCVKRRKHTKKHARHQRTATRSHG